MFPRIAGTGLVAALLLAGGGVRAEDPPTSALRIHVHGFPDTEGVALIAVYSPEDDWLDGDTATNRARLAVPGKSLEHEVSDLPAGKYAVAVVHDRNTNGELDLRWLPYPRMLEAVGMSNDPTSSLGPPGFEAAAFEHGADGTTVTIHLRQP